MKKILISILLVASIVAIGCVKTVHKSFLDHIRRESTVASASFWWYMGARDGYHYLRNEHFTEIKTYRIPTEELTLKSEIPYTCDRGKWLNLLDLI